MPPLNVYPTRLLLMELIRFENISLYITRDHHRFTYLSFYSITNIRFDITRDYKC